MSKLEPLISVVIPAYNYADVLPRAMESVLFQLEGASAELLVIDDGSTDATPTIIEQWHLKHPGAFRSVCKPNGGPASTRNRGIEEANGKFLVFLDADDEMAPGALAALEKHIASQPFTRLVIGGHWAVFSNGRRVLHEARPLPDSPQQRVHGYLLDKTISISNGACAMHREVFSCGNYPERFRNTEDIPVFAQVLARYPCSILEHPLALIHKHCTSLRHNLAFAQAANLHLVDEVFCPNRMPAELQSLKRAYTAQRGLSLCRTFYAAGEYARASDFYWKAVRQDWTVLFKWSYTRKAMRMLFRG